MKKIEGNKLSLTDGIYKNPTASVFSYWEHFPPRRGQVKMSALTSTQHCTKGPGQRNKERKKLKA